MPGKETVSEEKAKKTGNSAGSKSGTLFWRKIALILLGIFVISKLFSFDVKPKFNFGKTESPDKAVQENTPVSEKVNVSELQSLVLPEEGVELPIAWGELGKRMIKDGVIDEAKFRALFKEGLSEEDEKLLTGNTDEKIVMTQANSRFLLDLLWAFGLANKNEILTSGEMTDEKYGGDASKFASTGGWSLASGNVMSHYSTHPYVVLTKNQQDLVDKVSRGIYRPCCGNSTHFPDCNHGMAMLGLLELMAANKASEQEMYEVALRVNSYWFPQTYLDLATYFKEQGTGWSDVDPKLALSAQYSSGQGYAQTRSKIKSLPTPAAGGGGCGV